MSFLSIVDLCSNCSSAAGCHGGGEGVGHMMNNGGCLSNEKDCLEMFIHLGLINAGCS